MKSPAIDSARESDTTALVRPCERVNFEVPSMVNKIHVEKVYDAGEFDSWRKENDVESLDYRGLDLSDWKKLRFRGLNLEQADFTGARLPGAVFNDCNLTNARFVRADCARASLTGAKLTEADLSFTDLFEADVRQADFTGVKGIYSVRNLDTTVEAANARNVHKCVITRLQHVTSWEFIRNIGNLRLFAVSYTLLAFLMTAFYAVGYYNEKVKAARSIAESAILSPDPTTRLMAVEAQKHLTEYHLSPNMVILFVSSALLVVASGVYSFKCPDEIKDFTRSQWVYQSQQPLLHYWGHSWKYPLARHICFWLYVVGGISSGTIILWKGGWAVWYVWQYAKWWPS